LPAPDILLRNVNAAGSMAGVINAGGEQSPFFILSVASYSDTFAGMLAWEDSGTGSSMPQALIALFPPYPALVVASSVATTTPAKSTKPQPVATTTPAVLLVFHDEVVANHDARAYRDAASRTLLIYGYWNQTTLVIARDENTFSAILARLATSQSQQ
jgi:hypothetical protein